MVTAEKMMLNLKVLKSNLPIKPERFTPEYPKTIREAINYYCNQRTVHTLQACTSDLNDYNWPVPLWFDPSNLKVGFWNRFQYNKIVRGWHKHRKAPKLKDYDFFSILTMNRIGFDRPYNEIITQAFEANKKYSFRKLIENPIFSDRKIIINSLSQSYSSQNWVACINTVFPLLDFVVRKILKTKDLRIDVLRICKLFSQNGFSLETSNHLMPHINFALSLKDGQPYFSEERENWRKQMSEVDLGLIGPPLSSFIRFANLYYSYYKEDQDKEGDLLNRHAILHGSFKDFGTQVNTVKLLTFLHLILELEFVLNIILEE